MEQARHYLLQFSVHRDPEETKRYVEACFGKSMYTEQQQEEVERQLCTGNHKNSHLLFTRGRTIAPKHTAAVQNVMTAGKEKMTSEVSMPADIQESQGAKPETMPEQESTIAAHGFHEKREAREIREFQTECAEQYRKNKAHFEKNRAIYQNSIRKLTESLKVCLETQDETFPTMATHGRIHAPSVWKAVYLDNPRGVCTQGRGGDPGIFGGYSHGCFLLAETDAGADRSPGVCPGGEPGAVWDPGPDLFLLQHPRLHRDAAVPELRRDGQERCAVSLCGGRKQPGTGWRCGRQAI